MIAQRFFDSKGFGVGRSLLLSVIEGLSRCSRLFYPFSQRETRFPYSDVMGSPSVPILFFGSGPSAVRFRIRTIDINSIYRMILGWTAPHIFQKVLKVRPTFAYSDSSVPVMFPESVIYVVTPTQHTRPCSIFGGLFAVGTFAVLSAVMTTFYSLFTPVTPTTFSSLTPQHGRSDGTNVPTGTRAYPLSGCTLIQIAPNNCQTPKLYTC